MSRSYRKPYSAITGVSSAKSDKRLAARGVRRRQNQWLKTLEDFDTALVPHRYECHWNDTWCWKRDGSQMYWGSGDRIFNTKWFDRLFRK
jgi:hypothetical protein